MNDRYDDPSHHERVLYHGATSYSSLYIDDLIKQIENRYQIFVDDTIKTWVKWELLRTSVSNLVRVSWRLSFKRCLSSRASSRSSVSACSYNEGRKNVLFNDALNTFYLRLYGVGHMVKDHSDSEKGNPLPPHALLFPINCKGSFICTIPQTG